MPLHLVSARYAATRLSALAIMLALLRAHRLTDDVGDLYLMNTDGSDRTKVALPDSSVVEGDLSWSPEGARVAFVTSAARRSVLYRYRRTIALVNRDGSGVKLVL